MFFFLNKSGQKPLVLGSLLTADTSKNNQGIA